MAVGCVARAVISPVATIAPNAIAAYQSGHTNAATASTGTTSATGPPISAITTHTRPSPTQADSGGREGLNRRPVVPSAPSPALARSPAIAPVAATAPASTPQVAAIVV